MSILLAVSKEISHWRSFNQPPENMAWVLAPEDYKSIKKEIADMQRVTYESEMPVDEIRVLGVLVIEYKRAPRIIS